MSKFKLGDVIIETIGGCRHRIFHIIDDDARGLRYKALRIEGCSGTNWTEIHQDDEDKWEITDPPEGETKYTVGQVVIGRQGFRAPALIIKAVPGVERGYNQYTLLHVTLQGQYDRKVEVFEKDMDKEYVVEKDLNWVTQYGSPTAIVKDFLRHEILLLESSLNTHKEWLERIHHL